MLRLAFVLYLLIGATLGGSFMVAALTAGYDTLQPVVYSALAGFLLGIPIAWYVAQRILDRG